MSYVNLTATTRKKHIVHTQKNMKKNNITLKKTTKTQKKTEEKKGTKKNYKNNYSTFNRRAISTYPSIITLKVNGLNLSIKRQRVAEWMRKQDPSICSLQESLQKKRHVETESQGLKKIFLG